MEDIVEEQQRKQVDESLEILHELWLAHAIPFHHKVRHALTTVGDLPANRGEPAVPLPDELPPGRDRAPAEEAGTGAEMQLRDPGPREVPGLPARPPAPAGGHRP